MANIENSGKFKKRQLKAIKIRDLRYFFVGILTMGPSSLTKKNQTYYTYGLV